MLLITNFNIIKKKDSLLLLRMKYFKMRTLNFSNLSIAIFILFIGTSCNEVTTVKGKSSKYYNIDNTIIDDSLMNNYIAPYRGQLDATMNEKIGYSEDLLLKDLPEGKLSNLVSDIIQKFALSYINEGELEKLDLISIVNIKGLRAPISKGDILVKDIYNLMPFENEIVIVKLNSNQVNILFDHLANIGGDGISGANYTINNSKAEHIKIDSQNINSKKHYYIATSDYLANGGDYYTVLTEAQESISTGAKLRELIIEYIKSGTQQAKSLNVSQEQRTTFKQ